MTPESDIRKYLQTLSIGVPIYDRVPDNQATNYVHISDITLTDDSPSDGAMYSVDVLFDVVTLFDGNFGGRKQADIIGSALIDALQDNRIDIGSYYINRCRFTSSNYMDESSETHYIVRKLIRMEFIVEQL